MFKKIIILGGGIAGLTLANFLKKTLCTFVCTSCTMVSWYDLTYTTFQERLYDGAIQGGSPWRDYLASMVLIVSVVLAKLYLPDARY